MILHQPIGNFPRKSRDLGIARCFDDEIGNFGVKRLADFEHRSEDRARIFCAKQRAFAVMLGSCPEIAKFGAEINDYARRSQSLTVVCAQN